MDYCSSSEQAVQGSPKDIPWGHCSSNILLCH